jgi:hypothetical protein
LLLLLSVGSSALSLVLLLCLASFTAINKTMKFFVYLNYIN